MTSSRDDAFVAEVLRPSHRRLYVYRDGYVGDSTALRGWNFVVEALADDGSVAPIFDTWEETFLEILRYPGEYASEAPLWRRPHNAELVVLEDLAPTYL